MVRVALPVSHLFDTGEIQSTALPGLAEVLEFRKTRIHQGLPEKPAVFHWDLGLVQSAFRPEFMDQQLPEFLETIKAGLFSFDLGPACRENQHVLPLSPTLSREEIWAEFARSLDLVRNYYSGPLAAENYNFYRTGLYENICRPDFITASLDEFDLGLVLDLAHAWVSAVNLGQSVREYILELPLDKVREIHLSRPYFHDQTAVDAHLAPGPEDFDLLFFVLDRLEAADEVLIVIEYYQDPFRLEQAYLELVRRIKER